MFFLKGSKHQTVLTMLKTSSWATVVFGNKKALKNATKHNFIHILISFFLFFLRRSFSLDQHTAVATWKLIRITATFVFKCFELFFARSFSRCVRFILFRATEYTEHKFIFTHLELLKSQEHIAKKNTVENMGSFSIWGLNIQNLLKV